MAGFETESTWLVGRSVINNANDVYINYMIRANTSYS